MRLTADALHCGDVSASCRDHNLPEQGELRHPRPLAVLGTVPG